MADFFVDTNIFIRFLTNDDPAKARRSERLFKKAIAGEVSLETSLLVIAEIVWTLESFYKLAKPDIADKIGKILNTPNLKVQSVSTVLQALDVYVTKNVDFIDAYHGIMLRETGVKRVLTYDKKHFGRMDWLSISEP
ncbi:MAG: PIN domain-containing protein [Acidobacteria bacterium]|nr:MAG: PIN domain-containing protein [Acidobacteriota bacterium]